MMNEWKILNDAQAEELFAQHSMLIGECDRVPRFVALDLFGKEALHHMQCNFARCSGFVEIDGFPFQYITRTGFKMCVSFMNCKAVQAQAKALHEAESEAMRKDDERNYQSAEIALRLHPEMAEIVKRDLQHKATKEEQEQCNAWQREAEKLIGTPEGEKILQLPAPDLTTGRKRGRPRKA